MSFREDISKRVLNIIESLPDGMSVSDGQTIPGYDYDLKLEMDGDHVWMDSRHVERRIERGILKEKFENRLRLKKGLEDKERVKRRRRKE